MHNKNNVNQPSFKTELNIKITLLVFIPMLLSAIYFSYNAYQQAISLAREDVQRHASSLVLDIKTKITAQKYSFSTLSDNRVLGEVAVNILFSQYAFNELKELVLNSEAIDAAFISDGSEFIVEGFPLETLKINDNKVKDLANHFIAQKTIKVIPQLFSLTEKTALIPNTEPNYLFIVLPLRKQMSSLIKPFENTAALFLMLNPEYLFGINNEREKTSINISINNLPFYSSQWHTPDNLLSVQEGVFSIMEDGVDVSIEIGHALERYTEKVWASIGVTLLFIFIILIFVFLFMKNFTARLHRPIKALESQSKHFIEGNYYTSKEDVEFSELEILKNTLNTMATTITKQLHSLKEERNKAEASERIKARFLANMSHEIRTPLNGVHGLLKMIDSEPLSSNQSSWLQSADQSAKLLLTVVNDILDFSKIEEGKVELEIIPYNVAVLIANIKDIANILMKDKEISLVIDNKLTHFYWQCDPTRLSQIMVNLVSNAIKFTSQGQVTLTINTCEVKNGAELIFSVSDTGIGIAKDKIDKLFNSFEQADVSTTREFGGTGLGLAISKRLANLMGGNIEVDSEISKGSNFLVNIPVKKAKQESIVNDKKKEVPDLSKLHILIVEDNKINQTILKHALKQTGAKLSIVENGLLAVEKTLAINPDLILMDVQMPVMDGVEATQKIRAANYQGPIIMQTANVLDNEVEHYLQVGANDHISKPINANSLYTVINRLIKN